MIEIFRKVNDLSAPAQIRGHICLEEFFNRGKGDDVFPVVEVGMTCARDHHEQFVVLLTRSYSKFLVGVAAEIERMSLLSVENHHCITYL